MDGSEGQSTPLVRQLVKLPIIDRIKVVKDLMLGQLNAIHSQVRAIHDVTNALLTNDSPVLGQLSAIHSKVRAIQDVTNALLTNDSPLLESSINLVEAVRDTRLALDRHDQVVLDTVRQARQDALQQTQELVHVLRQIGEETRQRELHLLERVRSAQEDVERQANDLLGAFEANREEVREERRASLQASHEARKEAQGRAQELLDALWRIGEQTRALLDDVCQVRQDEQRQAQGLLDAMRDTRAEAGNRGDVVVEMLKRTDGAIREQSSLLLDALGEANRSVAQRGSQIETALGQLQALAAEERLLLQDGLERLRKQIQPLELRQGKAILVSSGYPEEPEVGLMMHLYSHVPSRVAVDVGANIGEVSHRLLSAGYEVFAFEPHPEVFRQLEERLKHNAAFHGFPWALGSTDETRLLHIATDRSGCNRYRDSTLYSSLLHHSMPDDLVFTSTAPVTVRCLGSLHAEGHLPANVSLVKIDTEGFDAEVIRGMDPHRYPVVVAEYWDQATPFGESGAMNKLEELVQEMRSRDYHWFIVFYRVWGKEGTSFYCNHPYPIAHSYGNVFFFRDYPTFSEALKWCAAVLPVTYLGG